LKGTAAMESHLKVRNTCVREREMTGWSFRDQNKQGIIKERAILKLFFFFFFVVLGLELRSFTLSHFTSPIFMKGLSR
jgi:hypothetical protein